MGEWLLRNVGPGRRSWKSWKEGGQPHVPRDAEAGAGMAGSSWLRARGRGRRCEQL